MSFTRRRIDLTFQLGQGAFGDSGFDTIKLSGLRVSADIAKAGGVSLSNLTLRAYGVPLSTMNKLSTLGKPLVDGRNNTVTVEAGSDDSGMAVAFSGIIQEGWVDLQAAPDGAFVVSAYTGLLDTLRPLPPSSFQGSADAATIMASLANQMGYSFTNAGVSVQLVNPYFPGTGKAQAEACAAAGDFYWFLDDAANTLAIWPKDGARDGAVPVISKATGMVGYPAHTQNGISLTTLYSPTLQYGGRVRVESILTPATGTWTVYGVAHALESETYDGKWFTTLQCSVLGRELPLG